MKIDQNKKDNENSNNNLSMKVNQNKKNYLLEDKRS